MSSTPTLQRVRRGLITAALLLVIGLYPPRSRADAADAQLVSLGPGAGVTGTLSGSPRTLSFAGSFNISIDGGALTASYCVDISHSIRVGDVVPQIPPVSPCEVVYILNNFYPHGTAVLSTSKEAAAVQSAIWLFTDGFQITSPADITSRANQVVAAAQGQCTAVPPVPTTITIMPGTDTHFLPDDATHTVTATLRNTTGQVIPSYPIRIDVAGAGGPKVFTGTTNATGQFAATYTNDFVVTGSDTITASATFTVPVGQEFKSPDKQGIVLAGQPQTGTVDGTATVNWVAATCGDGRTNQAGEECDDGNAVNGDGCDANCTTTRCGNNVRTGVEECDDGNATDGDGCDTNCTTTRCGNGVVTGGEVCDDANVVDGDGCDSNCKPTGCGNGVRTGTEQCDDGDLDNGDGCDANCTTTRCGNGIPTAGEECDDANAVDGDGCDTNCTTSRCGNGIRTGSEQCDDGNGTNGDGCDSNCTTSACGNGVVSGTEQCDDGNAVSGDTCDPNCTFPGCGNGVRAGVEQCDDHNAVNGDGCDANCTLSACGNGIEAGAEQCDDGNTADGDGCDSNCKPTGCGNGVRAGSEVCDDGNLVDADGCDSNCTPTGCGNGILAGTEQCDDGNQVNGDGCQADCTIQRCGNGNLDPGEQCDDGNLVDGDGCSSSCGRQEVCGNLEDEDGDGFFDCEDPDCVDVINKIFRDPARLLIFPAGIDRFRTRGGIPVNSQADAIQPATERVGVLITNTHNELFRQWIEPGGFPEDASPSSPNRWVHSNRATRTTGGVFKFEINKKGTLRDRHRIRLKIFGDFTAATEPTMTLQLVIGNNLFCNKASWTQQAFGWKLSQHDVSNEPCPNGELFCTPPPP